MAAKSTCSPLAKRLFEEEMTNEEAPRRSRRTTTSASSNSNSLLLLLGLKPLQDVKGATSTQASVVSVAQGQQLGRNPTTPSPKKSKQSFVNLGIVKSIPKGDTISRDLFRVRAVTPEEIVLQWKPSVSGRQVLRNRLARVERKSPTKNKNDDATLLHLYEGDVLILGNTFRFQVTRTDTSIETIMKENEKANTVTKEKNKRDVSPPPKRARRNLVRASRVVAEKENNARIATKKATNQKKNKIDSSSSTSSGSPSKRPCRRKDVPSKRAATKTAGKEKKSTLPLFRPPPFKTRKMPKRRPVRKQATAATTKTTEQGFVADVVESTSLVDIALGNAWWKAMNSNMPHIGATWLIQLMTGQNGSPPPHNQVVGNLVRLLTLGPQTGTGNFVMQSSDLSVSFWDGYRMHLASQWSDRIDPERLSMAAGKDHWKMILDELRTLPYVADLAAAPSAGVSKKKKTSPPEEDSGDKNLVMEMEEEEKRVHSRRQQDAIVHSLQLHTYSIQLLNRMVTGALEREKYTELPKKTTLVRNIQDYGERAFCKQLAQALAYMWLEYGSVFFCEMNEDGKKDDPRLFDAMVDITDCLTRLVQKALGRFAVNENGNGNPSIQIMASAWKSELKLHGERHPDLKRTKKVQNKLKVLWINMFGEEICHPEQTSMLGGEEWRNSLAKAVGVSKKELKDHC